MERKQDLKKMLTCNIEDIVFGGIAEENDMENDGVNPHQYRIFIINNEVDEDMDEMGKSNMIALVPQKCFHLMKKKSFDFFRYTIDFSFKANKVREARGGTYEEFSKKLKLINADIHLFHLDGAFELIKEICIHSESSGKYDIILAEANFQLLMAKLFMYVMEEIEEGNTPYINNPKDKGKWRESMVKSFLTNNYMQPGISAEDLCQVLGLSARQINRFFVKEYGCTFHQMLNKMRMNLAKKLLENTSMPVSEIAEKVGFLSSVGFLNSFKKQFGVSPSEFRKDK